ncbi:MAG: helix-turn-helix transcriptional regulator [Oscillospiraceae bacterium]|nr:helix-turn-helix transcriptional regulator [Oscillospiraceae bacterium]
METKEILKQLRKERGYSAKEVSDGCDMSLGVYKKYESGERGVGTPALCKLADFFGVTTDYLLGREKLPDPLDLLNLNPQDKAIVQTYISLNPAKRTELVKILRDIVAGADVQLTISKPEIQQKNNETTQSPLIYCGTVGEELDRRERAKAEQSEQKLSEPIVQSTSQNLSQPVQPQQAEVEQPWRMAARSTDGKYVSREMKPEEVELIESLEDVPKSRY